MTVRTTGNVSKLEREFWAFHTAHPEVYDELVRLCRDLKSRGYHRFGIATVYEVTRWRSMMKYGSGNGFKLNNNHRAFYARLIMKREPDLGTVFNTRKLGVPSHVA